MARSPVTVRAAGPGDVATIRELWEGALRRAPIDEQLTDVATVVAESAVSETQAVIVAEHDGQVAGAAFLLCSTMTPLNREPVVLVVAPHVFPSFQRRGVGTALMDAAARYAEQHGVAHLMTAAGADARDSNRFLARLTFSPVAMLRVAPTATVRAKVGGRRGIAAVRLGGSSSRHIDRVLAARRGRRERVVG